MEFVSSGCGVGGRDRKRWGRLAIVFGVWTGQVAGRFACVIYKIGAFGAHR
jgi:hypothetical protein